MTRSKLRLASPFIIACAGLLFAVPSLADSLVHLYEDCSAAHIPESARKGDDWIKVKRCENVVVSTVRQLDWPMQVPTNNQQRDGVTLKEQLICPNNRELYDEKLIVDFFLKHWDQEGMGFIYGGLISGKAGTIEAFTKQFPECANPPAPKVLGPLAVPKAGVAGPISGGLGISGG